MLDILINIGDKCCPFEWIHDGGIIPVLRGVTISYDPREIVEVYGRCFQDDVGSTSNDHVLDYSLAFEPRVPNKLSQNVEMFSYAQLLERRKSSYDIPKHTAKDLTS